MAGACLRAAAVACSAVLVAIAAVLLLHIESAPLEGQECTSMAGFHPYQCPVTAASLHAAFVEVCSGREPPHRLGQWHEQVAALASNTFCSNEDQGADGGLVLVVGAGPVGLMNAITLVEEGLPPERLLVLEERVDYNRDTWFDIDESTQLLLQRWGGSHEGLSAVVHEGTSTVSLRCQVLERFLSSVASTLGIPLLYGRHFMGLCGVSAVYASASHVDSIWHCDSLPEWAQARPAEVLVAADGSRSTARGALGLSYPPFEEIHHIPSFPDDYDAFLFQENVLDPSPKAELTVEGLHQVSVIVRLQADSDGKCASTRELLPWQPSYESSLSGRVTHVFKRQFHSYCEIQVLLSHAEGAATLRRASSDDVYERLPWDLLKDVLQVVMVSAPVSRDALLDALQVKDGKPYVVIFPIAIHRVLPGPLPLDGDVIGFVVGDAKMTAYYRLGIGINAAAQDLRFTRELARALKERDLRSLRWRRLARALEEQTERNARYQAASVFFEAYCDLLVLQDHDASVGDFLSRMLVFRKTRDSYEEQPLDDLATALQSCTL